MSGRHKRIAAAVLATALVVLLATGAFPDLPDAKKAIEDIAKALGPWTYALVGVLAFAETGAFVGLIAPGETTVMVGGVIAGQGEIELIPLIGLVWICCVLGDTTSFFVGRRLGRDFILRHGPRVKIGEARLRQVESYFRRHGGKTILIGRFIGLVRALAPFVAGSSGLSYRRFIPFSVIGCGLWGTLYCLLGYLFYQSFDRVTAIAGKATLVFGITVAVVVSVVYAYRRLRREEERRRLAGWLDRQGRRPLLRPLFAIARPVWRRAVRPLIALAAPRLRFLSHRLSPGDLGLELTSTLAVSGVGIYVFTLYTVLLSGERRTTPFDRGFLDMADDLHSKTAVDVVKVLTDLGAFPTVAILVLVVSAVLLARRRFTELVALVAGSLLVYVGVQLAKSGIDRPRPAMPIVSTLGSSYPSGHAAYSTVWVAVAVVMARAVPGLASRAALVGAGVAIAVAVGLSRIYLRAHYWSDVAGGWGLGAGALGASAAVAIVVTYIRHNGGRPETARTA